MFPKKHASSAPPSAPSAPPKQNPFAAAAQGQPFEMPTKPTAKPSPAIAGLQKAVSKGKKPLPPQFAK